MTDNQFELMPLFAKPIYISQLSIDSNVQNYVKELDYHVMEANSGQLSNDTYVLEHPELSSLKNIIKDNIKTYAHEILQVHDDIEFYITNSWVTLHCEGDYSPPHLHTNSLLSGTLYINIPKDDDSVFQIHAPETHKIFSLFNPKIKNFNSWNSKVASIKPETGLITLFPSDLMHSTTVMNSESDIRYCLAFNIFIKGEISDAGSLNNLKL